ncbi:MAG: hypothetical protein ACRDS0_28370 [Pseudonocardiaceae bacterium]
MCEFRVNPGAGCRAARRTMNRQAGRKCSQDRGPEARPAGKAALGPRRRTPLISIYCRAAWARSPNANKGTHGQPCAHYAAPRCQCSPAWRCRWQEEKTGISGPAQELDGTAASPEWDALMTRYALPQVA